MKTFMAIMVAGALLLPPSPLLAADQERSQTQTREQEPIFGSDLMSEKERNEYRERLRVAKTEQERERIRNEHHEKMLVRAKEKGVKLPDEPPAVKGGGAGAGGGRGPGAGGMGPGGGKGGGGRR